MNATTLEAYALDKGITTSFASMDNATKVGLAMQMFLEKTQYAAGNYAKENETLAGSMQTAKAAIENFLSGASNVDVVIDAAGKAADIVITNLQTIVPRLAESLPAIFNAMNERLPELFALLLPVIADGAGLLISGLANGILQNIPLIIDAAGDIVAAFADTLGNVFPLLSPLTSIFSLLADNLDVVLAALSPLIIAFGLFKTAMAISDTIDFLKSSFDNLSKGIDIAMDVMSAGAKTASNAATGMANASGSVGLLSKAFTVMTGPIGLVVLGITALIAIFVALYNSNADFKKAVDDAWAAIKNTIGTVIDAIVKVVGDLIEKFKEIYDEVMPQVKEAFMAVFNALKPFFEGWVKSIVAYVEMIIDIFAEIIDFIKNVFTGNWKGAFENIINIGKRVIEGIQEIFSGLPSMLWDILMNVITAIVDWGKEMISNGIQAAKDFIDSIVTFFKELPGKAVEWGKGMIDGFIDGIKQKIRAVVDAVSEVMGGVADFLGFNSPAKKGEGRHIVDWGSNMISGFEDGIKKELPTLNSLLSTSIEPFGAEGNLSSDIANGANSKTFIIENITIDAKNVKEFNDIVRIFDNYEAETVAWGV